MLLSPSLFPTMLLSLISWNQCYFPLAFSYSPCEDFRGISTPFSIWLLFPMWCSFFPQFSPCVVFSYILKVLLRILFLLYNATYYLSLALWRLLRDYLLPLVSIRFLFPMWSCFLPLCFPVLFSLVSWNQCCFSFALFECPWEDLKGLSTPFSIRFLFPMWGCFLPLFFPCVAFSYISLALPTACPFTCY